MPESVFIQRLEPGLEAREGMALADLVHLVLDGLGVGAARHGLKRTGEVLQRLPLGGVVEKVTRVIEEKLRTGAHA